MFFQNYDVKCTATFFFGTQCTYENRKFAQFTETVNILDVRCESERLAPRSVQPFLQRPQSGVGTYTNRLTDQQTQGRSQEFDLEGINFNEGAQLHDIESVLGHRRRTTT